MVSYSWYEASIWWWCSVLILIVVEDGIALSSNCGKEELAFVLILIVVEDGLVPVIAVMANVLIEGS